MRLSGRQVGLLINFHVLRLYDGVKRMVDGYDWQSQTSLPLVQTGNPKQRRTDAG
jgi:hypothetical protein